ncbi:MAG TPA: glycosyltransferase family 9 protein [Bacteroidota bacterium]|nr:glycosyltransferase family 9 protein [Bacteroidota bacterium]
MLLPPPVDDVRRLLVVKLRAIGDIVQSTVVTKNLRIAFPGAAIHFLTEPPGKEALRGNPYIDGVIVYDRSLMNGLDLIREVRRGHYDTVIDLFCNPRTALLTRLSGAARRVGFRFRGRTYAYNIVAEPRGDRVHSTQFNLDALVALGVAIQDRGIYFVVDDEDARFVEGFLPPRRAGRPFLVCINSGGGWYTKRWGLDRYAALADRIFAEWDAKIVLAWGPGQREEVEEIRRRMSSEPIVPPPTTLGQLGALLKRCDIVITNDSGPMHIAAAVGTPVLGIYGPTDPRLQGPYGEKHVVVRNESIDCLGCNLTKCPIGHPCMLGLDVETVFAGVRQLLAKNQIRP